MGIYSIRVLCEKLDVCARKLIDRDQTQQLEDLKEGEIPFRELVRVDNMGLHLSL